MKILRSRKISGCLERGGGLGMGFGYQQARGNLWNDESILKLDCGDGHTAVYSYKNYLTLYLQQVTCMVCKLHLSEPVTKIITRVSFEEDLISQSTMV